MPKPCSVHSAFLQQHVRADMDHFTTRDHCVIWAQGWYPGSSMPPHTVWGPFLQFVQCEEVYLLDFFHSVFIFEASSSKTLRFQGHYCNEWPLCSALLMMEASAFSMKLKYIQKMAVCNWNVSVAENDDGISHLLRKAHCLFMWQKNTLITFQQ